ncbi:hypothetical protein OSTOST_23016, partial [Ostertagia ostertagi]
MKLYSTLTAYVVEDDGCRLICSKIDGRLSVDPTPDVIPMDAEEVCDIISVIGRIDIDGVNYLLFVSESTRVAEFTQSDKKHAVYRIDRVRAIPLNSTVTSDGDPATSVSTSEMATRNTPKPAVMLDEVLRIFNDHPDFYFCFGRDITHSTYRNFSSPGADPDGRFFWNKVLLKDLLNESANRDLARKWIVPIMQGSISCDTLSVGDDPQIPSSLNITLISRRSVHRAGVRYLRRGIDCESNVANFVETELILDIFGHHLSFLYICHAVDVSLVACRFSRRYSLSSLLIYSRIHEIYHAAKMDCPDLYLVSFDLHRHCRGLKFDKINDLISQLEELLTQIGYCWVDKTGEIVKTQKGVVRTNCVDCLDRTNVVQWVCMRQAQRLGLFGPLCEPPEALVTLLQNMWADNGDVISTQYAGTAALKGDVTRSGERRLAGIMRDGYNSASRYYLSHIRDSSRQKAINALLDYKDQGSESMADTDSDSEEDENVCRLVAETVHFLLPEGEVVEVGPCVVQSRTRTRSTQSYFSQETSCSLLFTNDDFEKLEDVRIVPLDDVTSIEAVSSRSAPGLLRATRMLMQTAGWRAGRTRLFNNVAIRLRSIEEAAEYTESIAEQDIPVQRVERLSLPRSSNTAKKALASVAAAFKMRVRRPQAAATIPTSRSYVDEERGRVTTKPEPTLIDFELVDTDCSARESVAEFRDDMNSNTATIVPPQIHVSASDSCLVAEGSRPTPLSGGLVGRIRGLKPFTRSNDSSAAANSPFESLTPVMSASRTNFIML